jgi:hypothetical protein
MKIQGMKIQGMKTQGMKTQGLAMLTVLGGMVLALSSCSPTTTFVPPVVKQGLLGSYYNDLEFVGPALERIDSQIQFDWKIESPMAGMEADTFSVRWTGKIKALGAGEYTFFTTSDDGVRLTVDGKTIINNWTDHSAFEDLGKITLEAGKSYDITLEFYENTGVAQIELSWKPPGLGKEIIPSQMLTP